MDTTQPSGAGAASLTLPAHRVSPRAIGYWRLVALITCVVIGGPAALAAWTVPAAPTWVRVPAVTLVLGLLTWALVMPPIRYRVHRWEVTPVAVHTRSGWLAIDQRIAPLSRVQTVDSSQSALMRLYGLRSITVTTASAAGPITIEGLDDTVATQVVQELTAIVGDAEGDAT